MYAVHWRPMQNHRDSRDSWCDNTINRHKNKTIAVDGHSKYTPRLAAMLGRLDLPRLRCARTRQMLSTQINHQLLIRMPTRIIRVNRFHCISRLNDTEVVSHSQSHSRAVTNTALRVREARMHLFLRDFLRSSIGNAIVSGFETG